MQKLKQWQCGSRQEHCAGRRFRSGRRLYWSEPGVYSARYMGEDTSYEIKNRNIIERLANAEGKERSARFVCNITAVLEDGRVIQREAAMEGLIAKEPAGDGGFGYDPILYLPEFGKTSAELTMEEKNRISTEEKH